MVVNLAVIVPPTTPGRFGYQVRDSFSSFGGGGVNFDGSPMPERSASPAASIRSRRSSIKDTPIHVEAPLSRSHEVKESTTSALAGFYTGSGTTDRYGHDSSRPATTGYVPDGGARGTTPSTYHRRSVNMDSTQETIEQKRRQQEDLREYQQQLAREREEQQRRLQEEKIRDRDLQNHFLLDPSKAGVTPTTGRIEYVISESKFHDEKTLDPRNLEHKPRLKSFIEEHSAPTPEAREYLQQLSMSA
jgi:hypothetical protein